jgi:HK97 family phage portal protein
MPIVDKVLSRFGLARKGEVPIINDGRGNLPSVTVRGGGLGSAAWTSREYDRMATYGYQWNSDVYACVSLIAAAGKQVKWWDGASNTKAITAPAELCKAIGRDLDSTTQLSSIGDAERAKYIKALNPRPSIALLKTAGGAGFIEHWLSYILLSGNDYIEIERVGATPKMLYLQRPDRVAPIVKPSGQVTQPSEKELIEAWRITAYGQPRTVPYKTGDYQNIVHSKLFNPTNDILGMAPLEAAMLRVDAENEGLTLMKKMLQRGFSPGWIEAAKDSMWDEPQVAQLKERIRGSKQLGEELFLENATWHQMGFSPTDSGVTEQQILSKRDIASVFHVPSQLIGDTTAQTYSNYQEARRALYMEGVIPLLVQFRDDWNESIGRELNSPLDFDKDSFDAITAARAEATDRVTKLFTSGLITQAEARSDLEYAPAKPTDVFYAPANLMPLGGTDTQA